MAGTLPAELYPYNADFMPLYPAMGSLPHRAGLEVETSARLTTLVMTTIGFLCLMGIARRLAGAGAVLVCGVALAFTPFLLRNDVAVLTEPSYMGLVCLGLYLFVRRYGQDAVWYALLLGLIFGATFLMRAEGIGFVVLIPLLHWVAVAQSGRWRAAWKRALLWSVLFVVAFVIVATPQVVFVSRQMGTLAINGRQVWQTIMQAPGEEKYEERLYGLKYSTDTINLRYLQQHPEAAAALASKPGMLLDRLKNVAKGIVQLCGERIYMLLGLANVVFLGLGLYAIIGDRRYLPLLTLGGLAVILLIPPLIHNVDVRHILVIAPVLVLMASVGGVHLADRLSGAWQRRLGAAVARVAAVVFVLLLFAASGSYAAVEAIAKAPTSVQYYSPAELQEVADVMQEQGPKDRPARLVSRKTFLPYLSRSLFIPMPWTDYEGLVTYARSNQADFLYCQANVDGLRPFLSALGDGTDEFKLLYRGTMEKSSVALYQVVQPDAGEPAAE